MEKLLSYVPQEIRRLNRDILVVNDWLNRELKNTEYQSDKYKALQRGISIFENLHPDFVDVFNTGKTERYGEMIKRGHEFVTIATAYHMQLHPLPVTQPL